MEWFVEITMTSVSMSDVNLALGATLGKKGMLEVDINKLAEYLMGFFGFDDQIIDNKLHSETRDVFYMLEEEGFLTTRQEEVYLERGKLWRIHYWVLKTDQIQRVAGIERGKECITERIHTTYDDIPDACWARAK
jgi:hypothetical protein